MFIVTILLVLIVAGSFAGYFGIKLKYEVSANDHTSTFLLLEGTFDIMFPEGASVYKSIDTFSWPSDGEIYKVFIIPAEGMGSFGAQIKQLGWIEYTPDLFDDFLEEYSLWDLMYPESDTSRFYGYMPIEYFTHGYVTFISDDSQYPNEKAVFYYPDGTIACTCNEAMIFYDDITGRLYFFRYFT